MENSMGAVSQNNFALLRQQLADQLDSPFFCESLFDAMSDVVFFVKDNSARYVLVNHSLVRRCGWHEKEEVLGRTTQELFGSSLGLDFFEQDLKVLSGELEIHDQLELHMYPNREQGWCLTQKIPLRNKEHQIIGLAGISRDLGMPDQGHPIYHQIVKAVNHINSHFSENIAMADLANLTLLSIAQLERYFQKIFGLSPRQFMTKVRLEHATQLLRDTSTGITAVALACGYQDHSAFTRVFKSSIGLTPSEYRQSHKFRP
jgi:AraC-like DNA-binding protein